jgi:hypothetical protein
MADNLPAAPQLGGFRLDAQLPTDVFYGFRLDPKTGHLNIEVIANGSGVVQLPSDDIIDPLAYKQWLWTTLSLQFAFNQTNGHLEMTAL